MIDRLLPMAITISQLRTFVTVLKTGSVTRAGEELVVTQPSVSGALAALSKEVGARLVEREGRGLRATAAGAALLPYAETLLGLLEEGRQAAREAADPTHLLLRLAAVPTAAEFLVPPLLRAFRERCPEVEVSLEVGDRETVLTRLEHHAVDVGIGTRPPANRRISSISLLEDELVLITGPGDSRAARASVSARALAGSTWLIRERSSSTRASATEFFAHHGLAPPTLTIGSNGAIKQSVALGLGIALQARAAVGGELRSGRLASLNVQGGLPSRTWFALYATDGPRRAGPTEFLAFLRSDAAAELARGILGSADAAAGNGALDAHPTTA